MTEPFDEIAAYNAIGELLPPEMSGAEKDSRITTAASLFRQVVYTLECQGLPRKAVMAVLDLVRTHERIIDGSAEGGAHG